MTTRRTFIAGTGALAVIGARGSEKPLWKAGIVTDTHVGPTRGNCRLVQMACDLFASKNVDIFVNCGDIAERHFPEVYPILKEITDTAFISKPPRKIWVYANHDYMGRRNEPWEKVMADVKRLLGASNGFYDLVDMQGYPLVVFPEWLDVPRAERLLCEVCSNPKYAGKPIFVFDHVPPEDTTENSVTWGSSARRKLYSRFPGIINISGHVHASLRCERNIWQGEFTSVNMGCLHAWGGHIVGAAPDIKWNYGAVVMEVFADRVVFRRFDVRTKKEYGADEPWTVPLPFKPGSAPYSCGRAREREPVPQFPAKAVLSLKTASPFASVEMAFPCARGKHGTYIYKIQIATPAGKPIAQMEMFGEFYLPEDGRSATVVRSLSAGYFDPGKKYRVRVVPCNCFGVGGRPIETFFTAPAASCCRTLYNNESPMSECRFMTGVKGGKRLEPRDGWYSIAPGDHRLELPTGIWKAKGRYRFTVEMETRQPDLRAWKFMLRFPGPPQHDANWRIITPCGNSGRMRYVIEFDHEHPERHYHLFVTDGGNGSIRFGKVKVEKFESTDN